MPRIVVIVVAGVLAVGAAPDGRGDLITDWNALILGAVRTENTAPPIASRALAISHAAIFDAVNAVGRGYEPYHFAPGAVPNALPEAAALGAAYRSSVSLFPGQRAIFEAAYARAMGGLPAGPARDAGLALGDASAVSMLALRSDDGATTTIPYIPQTEPGAWRRTPPFFRPPDLPHWGLVTPFTMDRGDAFRPAGPPALGSERWAMDYNQVRELGARESATRSAYETESARFWSDFSYTVTPPGHWNQIAADIAGRQENTLEENARLFALLNLAMADAGIAAWDAKYEYNLWRPVTAIRAGDTDGNALTLGDPLWEPLLNTPPHPEYVSGHSTFSGAAAAVLGGFYGTMELTFEVSSDALPGVVREYDNVQAAAEEIGMSRIWGGIHYLSADLDGLATGEAVGEYAVGNFLLPIPEPGTAWLLAAGGILLATGRCRPHDRR